MNLRQFSRTGHWPTLLCSFLYFDVSFMVWTLMGALGVFVGQEFHLAPAQKGLLVAIPLLGGSILRIAMGVATDHFGPRKVGLAGLALTLVPLLWCAFASKSVSDLVGSGLLLGVAGASFAVALPLASRWYPPQFQGLALGIAGAGNSGTALATFFGPPLAPVCAVLLFFLFFARESPSKAPPRRLADYAAVLREADAWWFCFFY